MKVDNGVIEEIRKLRQIMYRATIVQIQLNNEMQDTVEELKEERKNNKVKQKG